MSCELPSQLSFTPDPSGPRGTGAVHFVVINADDLGICQEVNEAVNEAHRHGILTSASLMANGGAFDDAVENVIGSNSNLGVGPHLCLTSGRSVLPPGRLPDLVDASGRFRHGFLSLLIALRSRPASLEKQIEAELDAQFARIAGAGVTIDHVDSHRYVHMIPAIFDITVKLAHRFGSRWIRIPHERIRTLCAWLGPRTTLNRLRNLPKQQVLAALSRRNRRRLNGLQTADQYHGLLDSGAVTGPVLAHLLTHAAPGVTEIATHPAHTVRSELREFVANDVSFVSSPARHQELQALLRTAPFEDPGGVEIRSARFSDLEPKPRQPAVQPSARWCAAAVNPSNR